MLNFALLNVDRKHTVSGGLESGIDWWGMSLSGRECYIYRNFASIEYLNIVSIPNFRFILLKSWCEMNRIDPDQPYQCTVMPRNGHFIRAHISLIMWICASCVPLSSVPD